MIQPQRSARTLLPATLMFAFGLGQFGQAQASNDSIAIVAHPSSTASNVQLEDVRDLYLGKIRELPGTGPVFPVDLPTADALHEQFVEKILDKTPKELNSYWAVRIFTGRGTPPVAMADVKNAKEWIQNHKDAIGYMRLKDVDNSVKVILKLP